MKGRKWILAKHFDGSPKEGDLRLVEFDVPSIKDGEMLLEAVCLTVDPYMKPFSAALKVGDLMMGQQVARVIESKHKDYSKGDLVLTYAGWTTHSVSDGHRIPFGGWTKDMYKPDGSKMEKVDFLEDLPPSLALGVLGMTGLTAYFGLIDICKPKAGETVLVSGAAGAVGSMVGQIAKILGCSAIGFAGSEAKLAYLKELGFDEAINYKKITNLDDTIQKAAPKGVDCYFDNVGGDFSSIVIKNMNLRGRVSVCGAISQYNAANMDEVRVPAILHHCNAKRLKVEGFIFDDFRDKYPEAIKQLREWLKQGKLKHKEHVTNGFENMYKAFQELFTGANFGKSVVNV